MAHPAITGHTQHIEHPDHVKHSWHPWFAWRPVRLTATGERVWLKRIYRRAQYKTYATYDDYQLWEYGTLLCVLRLPPQPQHQGR